LNRKIIISVIDDDPLVRDSTVDPMNSIGYEAIGFESAEKFLDSDQLKNTSCLITDLQLPGLNGIQLQEQLQRSGHRTPVIFMTAFPQAALRARALAAGAVAFLSKPFKESALLSSLDDALRDLPS